MPHTNRKKKGTGPKPAAKIIHSKRQHLLDDDGWTHVVDAKPSLREAEKTGELVHAHAHVGDFEKSGFAYSESTLEEMERDLQFYERKWESDAACVALKKILREGTGRRRVGNVVALGLGSLQNARREGRRASWMQLVALRTIAAVLGGETKLPCVFQDPAFTALDKGFLVSIGYEVVDDPAAFEHVTEDSLVYGIHCYNEVFKSVSAVARPAMLIRNTLENLEINPTLKEDAAILMESIKDCEAIDFPQLQKYHAFSDTKIYWRKEEPRLDEKDEEKSEIVEKSGSETIAETVQSPAKTQPEPEVTKDDTPKSEEVEIVKVPEEVGSASEIPEGEGKKEEI